MGRLACASRRISQKDMCTLLHARDYETPE